MHCRAIEEIYKDFSLKNGAPYPYMDVEMFTRFFKFLHKDLQCHDADQDLIELLQKYINEEEQEQEQEQEKAKAKDGAGGSSQRISLKTFQKFMLSDENSLVDPEKCSQVYQDMNQPLTSYWIFSSHNTYLTGNQLTSDSSIESYVDALQRGCRCVEIDCWDGDDDSSSSDDDNDNDNDNEGKGGRKRGGKNEPVITHGFTLTSDIRFRDAIEAISQHAFDTSPYPVILSLENHCSFPQQDTMAKHLVEILGDRLVTSLTDPSNDGRMLSPSQLKGKFLIKGKVLSKNSTKEPKVTQALSDITAISAKKLKTLELIKNCKWI